MAAADRMTGKDLVVQFLDASGTVTLTGDGRNLEVTMEQETADMTAQSDEWRVMKPTVKNFSATFEAMYTGTAGTATMARVFLGDQGTLVWAPMGTAAGRPKWGIPVVVSNASQSLPYDDAAIVTLEFQGSGGSLTYDGNTATW